MLIRLFEEHAKEKAGVSETHQCVSWEDFSRQGMDAMKFELMIVPPYKRGPNKGNPNYGNCDRSSLQTVWVTIAEHKEWLKEYERKTGNCTHCAGDGKVMKSWNHLTGTEYMTCPTCAGTGKSSTDLPPAATVTDDSTNGVAARKD